MAESEAIRLTTGELPP